MKKKSTIIEFRNESTKFKIISIKSFYRIEFKFDDNEKNSISDDSNQINQNNINVIERNDFNEINQKKNFKSAKCIERYVSHRIIKFVIDQTRLKKIENFFRWNQFCRYFKFLVFMNYANKSIDDYFNQSINSLDWFLIENSFHSFQFIDSKQKKINDLLKKKFSNSSTNVMCYQIFMFSTHVL